MATRLVFLCAGATASSRTGAFPSPTEGLDAGGARKAAALRLGRFDRVISSPVRAATETAAALGPAYEVEPALADRDHGEWSGRTLADIEALEPDALMQWLAAPERSAADGESMAAVTGRVGGWMDSAANDTSTVLAISHAATLRGAIAYALSVPPATTLNIDIAPLTMLVLSHHGRWRLQELRRMDLP